MTINWVTRKALGWGPTEAGPAPTNKGLVIHYDGSNQGLANKPHSSCVTYWRNTRAAHMDKSDPEHGWSDIGYSYGVCAHGYVFSGREYGHYQAAQGTTAGNRDYCSVTLMCGDTDPVPRKQIDTVIELRTFLKNKGLESAVKGHRDFWNTDCPGDRLYNLVKNGTFTRPFNPEAVDEDMPQYVNVENTDPIPLPVGKWVDLAYDREWSDPNHHHWDEGGPSVVNGGQNGCFYDGAVDVVIGNLPDEAGIDFRTAETNYKTGEAEEIGKTSTHVVPVGDSVAQIRHPLVGYCNKLRKLRVQVRFNVPEDAPANPPNAKILNCQATLFIWPKP